ncbi:MAG TPA: hypothetical protein VF473_09465, partial [Cyclobacteriaceae bacterium]
WLCNAFVVICLLGTFLQARAQNAAPTIKFYIGDTALDEKNGVAAKDLPQLKIKVTPDEAHPNDVYNVSHWTLYIRHNATLGPAREGIGEPLHLTSTAGAVGDVIVVEFRTVTRTDADGKKEKVLMNEEMKYLSIAIK